MLRANISALHFGHVTASSLMVHVERVMLIARGAEKQSADTPPRWLILSPRWYIRVGGSVTTFSPGCLPFHACGKYCASKSHISPITIPLNRPLPPARNSSLALRPACGVVGPCCVALGPTERSRRPSTAPHLSVGPQVTSAEVSSLLSNAACQFRTAFSRSQSSSLTP